MIRPKSNRQIIPWSLFFAALFILSLDYWNWDQPVGIGPLHLPVWIYGFILLQLLLAAGIYLFSRKFWREPSQSE
ncbi:MAG: hypothetical protein KDI38_08325 [Calditrichaeota bacterium]|nr:hypothetical protein [Calditrichota bacterium]